MRMVFCHGAGGYDEDGPLARALAGALGASLVMPRLPDADMSVAGWVTPIAAALAGLGERDVVVGHSFGASMLRQALARLHPASPAAQAAPAALLLAMPDWGPRGWGVAAYTYSGPEPANRLTLAHCRDDDVVPVAHLAPAVVALPRASVRVFDRGGHQFDDLAEELAAGLAR